MHACRAAAPELAIRTFFSGTNVAQEPGARRRSVAHPGLGAMRAIIREKNGEISQGRDRFNEGAQSPRANVGHEPGPGLGSVTEPEFLARIR